MAEPAQSAPPENRGSFAGLLASFTSDHQNDQWDLSELADDVATIGHEQILPACRGLPSSEYATERLPEENIGSAAIAAPNRSSPPEKIPKTATVTLRLTAVEQAQLHERAAAAQLTVSAYVRSCIFDAESLRAQVKEALAQMHAASEPTPPHIE